MGIFIQSLVKDGTKTIGVIAMIGGISAFYTIDQLVYFCSNGYHLDNAVITKDGVVRGKGYCLNVKSVEELGLQINSRKTAYIGKPVILAHTDYGRLSKTQLHLIELFKQTDTLVLDKKRCGFKVTMQDLSCLTAYADIEFSLFSRPDKMIIMRGSKTGINLTYSLATKLLTQKYKWVGHTHPGVTTACLDASDDDYTVLAFLHQESSCIYNSAGQHREFGMNEHGKNGGML